MHDLTPDTKPPRSPADAVRVAGYLHDPASCRFVAFRNDEPGGAPAVAAVDGTEATPNEAATVVGAWDDAGLTVVRSVVPLPFGLACQWFVCARIPATPGEFLDFRARTAAAFAARDTRERPRHGRRSRRR